MRRGQAQAVGARQETSTALGWTWQSGERGFGDAAPRRPDWGAEHLSEQHALDDLDIGQRLGLRRHVTCHLCHGPGSRSAHGRRLGCRCSWRAHSRVGRWPHERPSRIRSRHGGLRLTRLIPSRTHALSSRCDAHRRCGGRHPFRLTLRLEAACSSYLYFRGTAVFSKSACGKCSIAAGGGFLGNFVSMASRNSSRVVTRETRPRKSRAPGSPCA